MSVLRHWWVHSFVASLVVPVGHSLWTSRLRPRHEEHNAEMDEIRTRRHKLEHELDELKKTGVVEATQRVSEVAGRLT